MKKMLKKALVPVAVAALAVGTCLSLAACGETKTEAPALTGSYNSSTYTFMTAYPGYTFKQLTTSVQTLNTYSDNTYMITVVAKSLSGDLAFDPSNDGTSSTEGVNDRGQSVKIYFGTYTASEENGLLTVSLSAPTSYVNSRSASATASAAFFNTAAWTDAMKEATKDDDHAEGMTGAEFLEANTFAAVNVVVDLSTYGFDYVASIK